jgi:hypothetical protein
MVQSNLVHTIANGISPALRQIDRCHERADEDSSFQENDFGKRIAMIVNDGGNYETPVDAEFRHRRAKIWRQSHDEEWHKGDKRGMKSSRGEASQCAEEAYKGEHRRRHVPGKLERERRYIRDHASLPVHQDGISEATDKD